MMTHHHVGDFLYWLAFFAGQLLHDLKRADIYARYRAGATKRAFLEKNWVVLLTRAALELPLFYGWRHYDVTPWISSLTGYTVPFTIPVNPLTSFLFGFFADSLLDWFSTWGKAPGWIKSEIPKIDDGNAPAPGGSAK
ncbi:MAG: hypothetical protein LAO08_20265 [Acidobacteriia bacterium]|nr:hypothetical protein [Terriglobia bacterium]